MTDLKPCPFCGGEEMMTFPPSCTAASDYDPADNAQPIVRCMTCLCEVMGKTWDNSMKTAIAAWNTRRAPVVTDAMVDAACVAYDDCLHYEGDPMHAAIVAALEVKG